ncbi:MAG: nuclear transport factor 2 family protein [Bacteroidota bacterium]
MTRFLLLALLLVAAPLAAQPTPADSAAIRAAATDYLMGYYEGDADRMERSIHPDLVKRIVRRNAEGRTRIDPMSSLTLVNLAGSGSGTQVPEDERIVEITILDIEANTATIKTRATGFFDYMHLARFGVEWKILNVLWDFPSD